MESQTRIGAVVVVYNTGCADSLTCRGLLQAGAQVDTVVICDNSTRDFGNAAFCREQGWVYLGGNGNVGISKAYNAAIHRLKALGSQVVCLFDDDTQLDSEYFTVLQTQLKKSDHSVFVPLIYSGSHLLSPSRLEPGMRIRTFADADQALAYRGEDITAINSCMAIRLSVFDSYRYDENIFLDGVDHHFMADMREKGHRTCVIPYRCNHEFSGDMKQTPDAAGIRFRIFAKDYRYILRNEKWGYLRFVGKRMLRLTLQHRSLRFLKIMLSNR